MPLLAGVNQHEGPPSSIPLQDLSGNKYQRTHTKEATQHQVEELLKKSSVLNSVKGKIRRIARGEADTQSDLRKTAFDLLGAKALGKALPNSPHIRFLNLCNMEIESEEIGAIAEGLKYVTDLRILSLEGISLSVTSMQAFASAITRLHRLKCLKLGEGPLGDTQMRLMRLAFKQPDNLPCLHVFLTTVSHEALEALAAAFPLEKRVQIECKHREDLRAFNQARPKRSNHCHATQVHGKASKNSNNGIFRKLCLRLLNVFMPSTPIDNPAQAVVPVEATLECERKAPTTEPTSAGVLGKTRVCLAAANATVEQQAEALANKNACIQELKAKLKCMIETVRRAETVLNLNVPKSRFTDMEKARNHKGKVIKGSYGTLYTAKLGGHRVALKQIDDVDARPHLAEILKAPDGANDEESKRLLREAHVLLSIRHPNIVSFLGLSHDDDDSTLSFVLSWAEGGSLYEHLHVHGRQLTKAQCARIAMEVAGAVRFLHAHGIVHRDLKSPNVLLDGSLSAKVTDFGLSAFKRGDDKTLTHQKGTPLWASPEQLLELKLYADTDVFSFGVLYWELCFNCKPWHHKGKSASTANIMFAYKGKEYLPVDEEVNGVMLSAAEQQLLGGCFDVSGNRLDFTQLHTALRELYNAAAHHQQLDEKQQTKMLFGAEDAVWKFPRSLLEAVKAVTKRLSSRPAVSIAPLDLKRDVDAVNKLLAEAGGPTAEQPNALKPFSHTLAAVAITHDKQKEAAFNGALARNRTRYRGHLTSGSSHPFSPKYDHNTSTKEPTNEEEKQVLRRVTCGTVYNLLDPSLLQEDPPLRLQRVFHGVTSWKAVVGILGGDFAALQQLDGGWYGAGFYFTPDLDYALAYAKPCTDSVPPEIAALGVKAGTTCRVVLACDVQYGNPYPVLDAKKFNGKPLESGHDAHMAVADFSSGGVFDAKPFPSHKEWTKQGKKPVAEIAMNDPSCVLVRAVLVFEA